MFPKQPFSSVAVVICSLNEEKNLVQVLPKIPRWVDEIILIDGHSTDHTIEVAKQLCPSIKVFIQMGKGKGKALKYGVSLSKSEIVVTLDADGTYPASEMEGFVQAIHEGYDFAKGTRFARKSPDCMTSNRKFGNRVLALTSNILFHTRYTDICSGYYAFRKVVFQKVKLTSDGFEMEQELFVKIRKMHLKVLEVPHSYTDRLYGKSKTQDFRQGFKDLLWIVSLRFRR